MSVLIRAFSTTKEHDIQLQPKSFRRQGKREHKTTEKGIGQIQLHHRTLESFAHKKTVTVICRVWGLEWARLCGTSKGGGVTETSVGKRRHVGFWGMGGGGYFGKQCEMQKRRC